MRVSRNLLVRALLIAAIVVGVAVDAFFAVVNFYPVPPLRSRGQPHYVVMPLDPVQAAWFEANVLAEFDEEANVDLRLIAVADDDRLEQTTAAAKAEGKDVVAVVLPAMQLDHALASKLVHSFADAIPEADIERDFASLSAPPPAGALARQVLASGRRDGKQAFLPRMALVDVLAYRVSKVRDAILHWALLRPQIDAALTQLVGHGLPAGYDLNLSPDQWDSYDLFVLGYYWAHRRYGGQPAQPRVAHRSGDALDGQIDIAAGIYGLGATDATFPRFDSPPARDYFTWEAAYRALGLYPPAMFGKQPFSDDDVVAALSRGDVFLAPIDARDAFSLHGGAHAAAVAHVDDPADLEFTELPNGASIALGANGQPTRNASFSFRQDWVWALVSGARDVRVGYDFARFLWRPEIHARECEALGMLPIEPSVFEARVSRFRLDWMTHIFEAGIEQALAGKALPAQLFALGVGSVYAQLWGKLVAAEQPITTPAAIADALHSPPAPQPLAPATASAQPVAAPPAAAPDDVAEAADHPPPETDDWEGDPVFDNLPPPAKGAR